MAKEAKSNRIGFFQMYRTKTREKIRLPKANTASGKLRKS